MKKNLEQQGMVDTGGAPQKFGERINGDYNRWLKVIEQAKIKID